MNIPVNARFRVKLAVNGRLYQDLLLYVLKKPCLFVLYSSF
jgi:hypothetical protein